MNAPNLSSPGQFMSGLGASEGAFPADQVAANIQNSTASMRRWRIQPSGDVSVDGRAESEYCI